MFCRIFLISFVFLHSLTTTASPSKAVAKVDIVRGKVTKLIPGSLLASVVKPGDELEQDTSILTDKSSFVRVTFVNNTTMNIGPNSKIVIVMAGAAKDSKTENIISLLKGKIRSNVDPTENSQANKLIIKTRTAALGVRGTDFQTIYNPDNQITNLLTFRGEVAMANIEDNKKLNVDEQIQEVSYERDQNNKLVAKKGAAQKIDQAKELNNVLSSKESVVVKGGQFSATTTQLGNVSLPVKINPAQLGILYQNDSFLIKDAAESKVIKDAADITKYAQLEQVAQEAPPEGFYDEAKKIYAPKAGGFIDTETGLYVPPEADAKFDIEKQMYIPKVSGQLETDTGEYIAPKGLKLSGTKGFVLTSREGLKNEELVALTKNLNTNIGRDLFIRKKSDKNLKVSRFSLRESFTRDQLEFRLAGFSDSMDFTDNPELRDQSSEYSGGKLFSLTWLGASDGIYRPLVGLNYKVASYDRADVERDSSSLYAFRFGFDRYFTARSFWRIGLMLHQELVASQSENTNQYYLSKVTLTSAFIGIDYDVLKGQKFSLNLFGDLKVNSYKNAQGVKVKAGIGHELGLGLNYLASKANIVKVQFFNDTQKFDVEQDDFKTNLSSSESGLRFVFTHIF